MTTTLLDQEHISGTSRTSNNFARQDQPPLYVDVRTPQEFESVHMTGARNIPLPDLHAHLDELKHFLRATPNHVGVSNPKPGEDCL